MATEEQILELARNLYNKHLVASMSDALERARMILQNVPDFIGTAVEGDTAAEAAGVVKKMDDRSMESVNSSVSAEAVFDAQQLPKDSGAEKSGAKESAVESDQEDLSKIKKDLDSFDD